MMKMSSDPEKRSQLNLRLRADTIETARFVAAINGQSLSEFVRETLNSRAIEVIEAYENDQAVVK
ncbi:MAG: DUF1778 domain-containing protein [Pyrinomonadaceae bacterium]